MKIVNITQLCPTHELILKDQIINNTKGFYSVQLSPNAMLVEPINGDTYIYNSGGQVRRFESLEGSGTDKLRCRLIAQLEFNQKTSLSEVA